MLGIIMLSIIMLSVIMLSVGMLVSMLCVIMLSVLMLAVEAPPNNQECLESNICELGHRPYHRRGDRVGTGLVH
jgi:hypothetical protein